MLLEAGVLYLLFRPLERWMIGDMKVYDLSTGNLHDNEHINWLDIPGSRDIEYVSALALSWPVKHEKAEATYERGLLRAEVPFQDPMEDAVKVAIKAGGADTKTKMIEA